MQAELTGKRVILRAQRREDAAFFARWYNEPQIMFQCGFTEKTTLEAEIARIEQSHAQEDQIWYTITDRQGRILGETGLLRMWPVWHCTDLSVILPDPDSQGRGYGTEAVELMFHLAFEGYDMNRVAIGVVEKNAAALRFYERLGFRREGLQEQGYYYAGEYSDFVMMRLLRDEWRAQRML